MYIRVYTSIENHPLQTETPGILMESSATPVSRENRGPRFVFADYVRIFITKALLHEIHTAWRHATVLTIFPLTRRPLSTISKRILILISSTVPSKLREPQIRLIPDWSWSYCKDDSSKVTAVTWSELSKLLSVCSNDFMIFPHHWSFGLFCSSRLLMTVSSRMEHAIRRKPMKKLD